MNTLFADTIGFSLVALAILLLLERRAGRGLAGLQRLALVLLLLYPLLAWLPKWHVLPVAGAVAPAAGGATAAGGGTWWLWLWLLGAAVQGVRLGLAMRRLAACRAQARPVTEEGDLALAAECARALGLRRRVGLRVCPAMAGAAACGVRRPVVLLPRDWQGWSEETKRAVLLHELGHHASRDPLWRLISLAVAAVYWFNPLVWWLVARLQRQAEFTCDARVVGSGFRADRYAHILCDLASRGPAMAMAMAAPGGLEQRVRMLHTTRGSAAPLLLGAAAAVLATCALGLAVLRPGKSPATAELPQTPTPAPAYTAEEIDTRHQADPFPVD